jgi:hypothetical protein
MILDQKKEKKKERARMSGSEGTLTKTLKFH